MPGFVFALSISHFVSSVGADAGFAALIGLAILVLLYFAQARETATLRDRAAVLEARAQQLEARLASASRVSPVAPNGPAVAGPGVQAATGTSVPVPPVPQPSFFQPRPVSGAPLTDQPLADEVRVADRRGIAAARAPLPAAPAGTAGPALAAATRLIPGGRTAETPPRPPVPTPAAPRPPVPSPAAAAAAGGAAAFVSRPATVAGGANGSGTEEPADEWVAPRATAAPQRPAPAPAPAPASPLRSSAVRGGRDLPPQRDLMDDDGARPPRSLAVRLIIGGLLAVLVVGVVLILINVTGSGSSSTTQNSGAAARTTNAPGPIRPRLSTFNPATVTVAVLNGTSTAHLAHRVSQQLSQAGYRLGPVVTAPDQTHTSTIIAYLPGDRAAALHVASALNRAASSVQPVDSATQPVACPPPGPCPVQVVVTVGADLATGA